MKTHVRTLELKVMLIFSIISTKISSLLLPPGSVATTDFVTAVPGILFVPCCTYPNFRTQSNEMCKKTIKTKPLKSHLL